MTAVVDRSSAIEVMSPFCGLQHRILDSLLPSGDQLNPIAFFGNGACHGRTLSELVVSGNSFANQHALPQLLDLLKRPLLNKRLKDLCPFAQPGEFLERDGIML